MKATIGKIIEPYSQRVSKAGKPYAALKAEVDLEDGSSANIMVFEDKAIGDELELVKKGDFWNVVSVKKEVSAVTSDVSKVLNEMYKMIEEIHQATVGED